MPLQSLDIAEFSDVSTYTPSIGDFIIWAGYFSTLYGVVSSVGTDEVDVIFEATPRLLFTLNPTEMENKKQTLKIAKIRSRKNRCYIQHDRLWYV